MVTLDDVVQVELSEEEIKNCIEVSKKLASNIVDRQDLHHRDFLERFNNVLMGEIAEQMVIKWLISEGKYAQSAVNKESTNPDPGHDILLKTKDGSIIRCSVKSSLSVFKPDVSDMLSQFKIATTSRELREVNIQVYFWLDIYGRKTEGNHRVNLPNHYNSAIMCWAGSNDLESFSSYNGERRQAPDTTLSALRPLSNLLDYLS